MLYSILNPETVATVGNVKATAQVLAVAVITGAVGKITTFTVLLTPQDVAPAVVPPQVAASTYLAVTV
jgi:hypothetical protein